MQGDIQSVALRISSSADRGRVQKSVRHLQFWQFELQSRVKLNATTQHELSQQELIETLVQYLFIEQRWTIVASTAVEDWLFHAALENRRGTPWLTLLLLQFLAEPLQIQVQPLSLSRTFIARLIAGGEIFYINLCQQGAPVIGQSLIENIGEGEIVPENFSLPLHYLEECLKVLMTHNHNDVALELAEILCQKLPRRMDLIAQRALIKHRHGLIRSALSDFRRYFAFYSEQKAPRELVRVYRRLSTHLRSLSR